MSENTILVLAFLGIAAVAVAIYILYRYMQNRKKRAAGREYGIESAVGAARRFATSNGFRFLPGATYGAKGRTAALDAVVVGYFGVLGVRAMGYNGEIYGAAGDDGWLQVAQDGTRTQFANPITGAAADVRVLRDVLIGHGLRQVPVEVVSVFTNSSAQLAIPKGTGHLTLKDFKALLGKEKYLADTGLDLEKVFMALQGEKC